MLKRRLSRFSVLAFLLLAFTNAYSAEPAGLKELLEEARSNNSELAAMRERVNAREARARAEGRLEDPTLKIEMEDLSKDEPLNAAPGNAMLTRYTIAQEFPFPGKLTLREKIAMKEARSTQSGFNARALEVALMVKEAYYEHAFLAEAIATTEGIKELLKQMSDVAQSKYSVGQVSQQDILKVNIEEMMLTNELITLGAEKELIEARLKSILNRPQASSLEITAVLPKERVGFSTQELIDEARKTNPEIRMSEYEAEAGELATELSKKNYYPDFMVGVAPIQRDGRFDSYDLMFQINIPIWRGKYSSLESEAASNARALRSSLASQRNVKGLEVKDASVKVDAADRTRALYETSLLPQAELSFESALRNYRAGKVDFLTLIETERELRRTRIEYLRSIMNYRKSIALLEKAVGRDLAAY